LVFFVLPRRKRTAENSRTLEAWGKNGNKREEREGRVGRRGKNNEKTKIYARRRKGSFLE